MGSITISKSIMDDAHYIADHMSIRDKDEIWASHHHTPHTAMMNTIGSVDECITVKVDGIPVMMFGVNGDSLISDRGTIWMLSTDEIKKIRFRVARHSRKVISALFGIRKLLYNYVDARNIESIQWLKFCGAEISDAAPYGMDQLPFHYFQFKRG